MLYFYAYVTIITQDVLGKMLRMYITVCLTILIMTIGENYCQILMGTGDCLENCGKYFNFFKFEYSIQFWKPWDISFKHDQFAVSLALVNPHVRINLPFISAKSIMGFLLVWNSCGKLTPFDVGFHRMSCFLFFFLITHSYYNLRISWHAFLRL